jgi:hypothetical protein
MEFTFGNWYTKWRENLPKFNSVQELSKAAMEIRKTREV